MTDERIAEIRRAIQTARQTGADALPTTLAESLLAELVRTRGFLDDALDLCDETDAARQKLRRLLGLLWQRTDEPTSGDVKEGAGLYIGHKPHLSAAEFREIRGALEGDS